MSPREIEIARRAPAPANVLSGRANFESAQERPITSMRSAVMALAGAPSPCDTVLLEPIVIPDESRHFLTWPEAAGDYFTYV